MCARVADEIFLFVLFCPFDGPKLYFVIHQNTADSTFLREKSMLKYLKFVAMLTAICVTDAFCATTNTFPLDGSVGIGSTVPIQQLGMNRTVNTNTVAIGFSTGAANAAGSPDAYIGVSRNDGSGLAFGATANSLILRSENSDIHLCGYANPRMTVKNNGNVGIGTTNPSCALTVIGTISAKEVRVTANGFFPDYVFAKDYKLAKLSDVEKYIDENKHLPGIPSAAEIEQNGLGLSEMSKKQMEKIEELTLYMIELKKENEALKKRIEVIETSTAQTK
jgi:hypothetical protein